MYILLQIGGEIYNKPLGMQELVTLCLVITAILVFHHAPSRRGMSKKDRWDMLLGYLALILTGIFLVSAVQSLAAFFKSLGGSEKN